MILIAFCLTFGFRLIWFAIRVTHFIGSTAGILMSSSITISLYCRETALRLMLRPLYYLACVGKYNRDLSNRKYLCKSFQNEKLSICIPAHITILIADRPNLS